MYESITQKSHWNGNTDLGVFRTWVRNRTVELNEVDWKEYL